tara:strand:+ start:2008 stop:2166 length:159 start_codon:yes stop_codon:yes gene_type:complete
MPETGAKWATLEGHVPFHHLVDYYNRQRPHTFNGEISAVVPAEKLIMLARMS